MKGRVGFKILALLMCAVTIFFLVFFATAEYRASKEPLQSEYVAEPDTAG